MELNIYTDGGALNNPGPAASAFVVFFGKKIIFKKKAAIGENTNNIAEYMAVVMALEKLPGLVNGHQAEKIVFYSDSRLMVNQLNGLFKVKDARIREQIMKIRILENKINLPIIYKNIPREQNQIADGLVKEVLT